MVVAGPDGRREIPITEFFLGFFETAMAEGELIVELRVPRTGSAGWAYEKFTRRENDWPIVAAAAVHRPDGSVGVALANMGGVVLRASAVEAALAEGRTIEEAAELAAEGTSPTLGHARRRRVPLAPGPAADQAGAEGGRRRDRGQHRGVHGRVASATAPSSTAHRGGRGGSLGQPTLRLTACRRRRWRSWPRRPG